MAAITAMGVVTAVGGGTAAAQNDDYPPGAFSISLSLSVVAPGAAVTATVSMCNVGVTIRFGVDGTGIQRHATCQSEASVTFNAPTAAGEYTVRAVELSGSARSATARLTVVADDPLGGADDPVGGADDPLGGADVPQAASAGLPGTGIELVNLLSVGAAAIVLGLGAVAVARRRRLDVHR